MSEGTARSRDLGDAVDHQHRRQRKLRVAGSEHLARRGRRPGVLHTRSSISCSAITPPFEVHSCNGRRSGPVVVSPEHPYHRLFPAVKSCNVFSRKTGYFPNLLILISQTAYINVSMQWATARSIFDHFCYKLVTEPTVNMHSSHTHSTVSMEERLREAGLRPTRQRVALASLIFAQGDRHLSAEDLHEEAVMADVPVRSPPYTTRCTSLRKRACCASSRWKGPKPISTPISPITSTSSSKGKMWSSIFRMAKHGQPTVSNMPEAPEGMEIVNVDIIVRLRRQAC